MSGRDFWSRRQAAVEAEAVAEERAVAARQATERDAEVAEQSDAEILAALELPEPESLVEGDDFKVFLTEQVPARIKTRALRHLWRANPVLACVDGLVDYGEDFTDAACVIEGMQTAYQVGKGMTKHVEEMARQAELDSQAAHESDAPEASPNEPGELTADDAASETVSQDATSADQVADITVDTQQGNAAQTVLVAGQDAALAAEITEDFATAAPRRMRFSFEGVRG